MEKTGHTLSKFWENSEQTLWKFWAHSKSIELESTKKSLRDHSDLTDCDNFTIENDQQKEMA